MNRTPSQPHLPFLDWLKAVGLALIVFGHVAFRSGEHAVPPIFQKQLGVAFFVFATGFTLARERRPPGRVLYNRLFEIVTVGLAFAVLMSGIGIVVWHEVLASNYLPFFLGANGLFDAFPANPTTWYIGTYVHILALWAVALRRLRITLPVVAAGFAIECAVRACLIEEAGRYIAYMFVGNWLTVLLLGLWIGGRTTSLASPGWFERRGSFWAAASAAILLTGGWWWLMGRIGWVNTFPFMSLGPDGWGNTVFVSAMVSFVYASYTLVAWLVARTLPASRLVELVARNTVVVVIVHMPVFYLLHWALSPYLPYPPRAVIHFTICLFGLSLLSELLMSRLQLKRRRDDLAAFVERLLPSGRTGSPRLVPGPSSSQP